MIIPIRLRRPNHVAENPYFHKLKEFNYSITYGMNGKKYLLDIFIKGIFVLLIPIFFVAISFISRTFYGSVLLEIRNGKEYSISIDSLEIKRCPLCKYEKLKEPKMSLNGNQWGYVGFNAKPGILSLRLIISEQDNGTNTLIFEIDVTSTGCEATAYIYDQQMTCDPCKYFN